MTCGKVAVYVGMPAAALALVCLYEASCEIIGDGSIAVTVTVRSKNPIQLRKVTFDHFGQKTAVDECPQYPRENEWAFREASVISQQSFQFDVLTSDHTSPLGILKNRFYWRRFAVFRIETATGEVTFVGTEVPDVRTNRSIVIDIQ